jgi:hypothetical protein
MATAEIYVFESRAGPQVSSEHARMALGMHSKRLRPKVEAQAEIGRE